MPFTPFHMGPGLLFKAFIGRHFSLIIFGFSQILIDVEPLIHILRRDKFFHGTAHTLVGATVVAALTVLLGRPICKFLLQKWIAQDNSFEQWVRGSGNISWSSAIFSAVIGTYSHVFLDSVMHFMFFR